MAQPNPQPVANSNNTIWLYLSYLLGWLFGLIGLAVVKDDDNVRFHCAQALALDVAVQVAGWVLTIVFIGWLVLLAGFVYRIYLMIQAANGKTVRVPVIGDFVQKNLMNLFK